MYRTDASHAGIKRALLAAGVRLMDTARHHGLGCDLLAAHVKTGVPTLLEVKNPGPPSSQKLTESELALRELFAGHFHVVTTPEQALRAVGIAC